MAIRWTKKDEALLKKSVNNYNKKINRLLKKEDVNKHVIPEKLNYKTLRENIEDRSIFNEQLKINKAFTRRGGEEIVIKQRNGIIVTKAQQYEIDVKIKKINKERERLKKHYLKFKPHIFGVAEEGQMKNYAVGVNSLDPIKFNPKKMYNFDMKMYLKGLDEYYETSQKKNMQYVENFKKSIQNEFNEDVAEKFNELFEKIPDQVIVDMYYIDENLSIAFNYEIQFHSKPLDSIEELYMGWRRVRNKELGKEEDDDTMLDYLYGRKKEEDEEVIEENPKEKE